MGQAAPGWYDDGTGIKRYWDGQAWGQYAQVMQLPPKPPSSGNAVAAFWVALAGFLLGWIAIMGLMLALAGLITGVVAMVDISKQPKRGAGFAVFAIILGGIGTIWGIYLLATWGK